MALGGGKRGRVKRWASHPKAEILDLARAGKAIYAAEAGSGGTALRYGARRGAQKWFYKTDGNVQAVTVVGRAPVFGMHGDNVAPRKNRDMSRVRAQPAGSSATSSSCSPARAKLRCAGTRI